MIFDQGTANAPMDLASLYAKIGKLPLEKDFLENARANAGLLSAKLMVERQH